MFFPQPEDSNSSVMHMQRLSWEEEKKKKTFFYLGGGKFFSWCMTMHCSYYKQIPSFEATIPTTLVNVKELRAQKKVRLEC
jgi:hypothetical protein